MWQGCHGGQCAILQRLQGHRQRQDGLDGVWLNSELLHSPKGFGNLKQPCQLWQGAGSPREQLYHLQCFLRSEQPWEVLAPHSANARASHPSTARSHLALSCC